MNSFLLTIAGILILALSAAFAVPHVIDWPSYRYIFEAQATKLVGRTVGVGGDVRLSLLPTPVLRFEGVEVADSNGSFETPFAKAQSLTIWLSVPPLLSGTLEAREIEIEKPVLNLSVDETGRGNWHDLGSTGADLPFAPKSVTLDEVNIVGASITLRRSADAEPWTLDGLSGVLSAKSLNGPYKFNGTFPSGESQRELRFSTTRREDDGSVRLKGVVRSESRDASYSVDGSLAGFADTPRFEGAIVAQFAGDGDLLRPIAKDSQVPVEVKSTVTASLRGANFDAIEATIRRKDRPQTINGSVATTWHDGVRLEATIGTRWFNFDPLIAGDGKSPVGPATTIAIIADRVLAQSGKVRTGRLRLAIDQAIMAGDIINDLEVDLSVDETGVDLANFTGRLPGDNELALRGRLQTEETGLEFRGDVTLSGKKLNRLMRWSGWRGEALPATAETGSFSLRAALTASREEVLIEKAQGDALGTAFTGSLRYRTGKRREFALELDSDRIDIVRLFGPSATPRSLLAWATGSEEKGDKTSESRIPDTEAGEGASWLDKTSAEVDLRVGAMVLPNAGDVALDAKLHLRDGSLAIRRLNLTSKSGLVVRAEGVLSNLANQPDGKLTMSVDGPERQSLQDLAALFEIPESRLAEHQLNTLSPMRVVVAIESKRDVAKLLEARIGGTLGASNVSLTARYQGDLASFETARLGLRGTVSNQDGRALIGQLFAHMAPENLSRLGAERGVLTVAVDGAVSSTLEARLALDAAGLNWVVDGKAQWQDAGLELVGRTAFRARDMAGGLVLAGFDLGPREAAQAIDLRAQLAKKGDIYELTALTGLVGEDPIQGRVRVDLSNSVPRFDAALTVSQSSLTALIAPAITWRSDSTSQIVQATSQPYWSEKRFDTDVLADLEGVLELRAEKLELTGALVLDDATLDARLEKGTLDVTALKGRLFGGTFDATAKLIRRGANLALVGKVAAKAVRLERFTGLAREQPLAEGAMELELALTGEGLSPSGLAAGLTGEGEVRVADGTLRRLSPEVLQAFTDEAAIAENTDKKKPRALKAQFADELRGAEFRYRATKTTIVIRNGTASFKDVVLENDRGQAKITSYLELTTLKLDSEWVLQSLPPADAQIEPEVRVAFAGPLTAFGNIDPQIDTQTLERYITMRRMEQDVERLEKLDVAGREAEGAVPDADGGQRTPDGATPQGGAPISGAPPAGAAPIEGVAPQGSAPAGESAAVARAPPASLTPAIAPKDHETPAPKEQDKTAARQKPERDAAPVKPAPVDAAPAAPMSINPVPVENAPVRLVPVKPAPVETAPVEAAPVETVARPAPPVDDPRDADQDTVVTPLGVGRRMPEQEARVQDDAAPGNGQPASEGTRDAQNGEAPRDAAESEADAAAEPPAAEPRGRFNVLDLLRDFAN